MDDFYRQYIQSLPNAFGAPQKQESLKPYIGQPPMTDPVMNIKKNQAEIDNDQRIIELENTILSHLLSKYPQYEKDLWEMYHRKRGRQLDSELTQSLMGRTMGNQNLGNREQQQLNIPEQFRRPGGRWM